MSRINEIETRLSLIASEIETEGADVNARYSVYYKTPLQMAAYHGYINILDNMVMVKQLCIMLFLVAI